MNSNSEIQPETSDNEDTEINTNSENIPEIPDDEETEINTIQVDTENLIIKSIGILLIIIILVLIYYIISTIIRYNKRHDLMKTIRTDRNAIFLNESLYNQSTQSKDISNEYVKKYTISNNQDGYFNYNLISNPLDNRVAFQTPNGNLYLNLKK